MTGRPTARRLVAAAVAAALAAGTTACGGPTKPAYDVAPAWRAPALASAPSAAAFCSELATDVGHLRDPRELRSPRALEGDFAGFFAAMPALVASAPPRVQPAVRTFTGMVREFYQGLLQQDFRHQDVTARLRADLSTPAASRAASTVESYAARACRPDPLA